MVEFRGPGSNRRSSLTTDVIEWMSSLHQAPFPLGNQPLGHWDNTVVLGSSSTTQCLIWRWSSCCSSSMCEGEVPPQMSLGQSFQNCSSNPGWSPLILSCLLCPLKARSITTFGKQASLHWFVQRKCSCICLTSWLCSKVYFTKCISGMLASPGHSAVLNLHSFWFPKHTAQKHIQRLD